jgi:hypothetical protein
MEYTRADWMPKARHRVPVGVFFSYSGLMAVGKSIETI